MKRLSKIEATALLAREAEVLPARFEGCVMCAVAAGFPEDIEVLASRPGAVAVLDRFATRRGHALVVLRRHEESIAALPWEEYAEVQRLAWETARAMERTLRPVRVFVAALGSARRLPMSFPHYHVHVIPLFDGDARDRPAAVLTWSEGVSVYDEGEASALAGELRGAWE